jgi:hypothetical protein
MTCAALTGIAATPEQSSRTKSAWKFTPKYKEWKALLKGKHEKPENAEKAKQILSRLIKGIYVVRFGPANGFNPRTAKEYITVFFKTSSLRSNKERLSIGFLRTKRQGNKLIASFLTDQPNQMKQDIERNPKLVFMSMEKMTPETFISYDKSKQESLRRYKRTGHMRSSANTHRFIACENTAGTGLYWVDSSNGNVWQTATSETNKLYWKYLGQPQGAQAGTIGTYVPKSNKNAEGLFILNTITGEGWWTNGRDWKALGKPEKN